MTGPHVLDQYEYQTEEEIFTNDISDEALEAAGSGKIGGLFTLSFHIFNCQFC